MRPVPRFITVVWLFQLAVLAAQGPTFHGGINLLRLDVAVVTDDGTPVTDLKPDEFVVTVDGKPRPVRSAEFVDLRSSGGDAPPEARDPARSFSTNSPQGTGRITVLAVDEHTLYEGQEMALMDYLGRFLDEMGPADRTGLLVLPHPGGKGRHVEMTNDVGEIREALSRVHGETRGLPSLNPSAGIGGDAPLGANGRNPFETPLEEQVMSIVRNELTNLAEVLANVDGPKTLILVTRDVPGGAPNLADNQIFAESHSWCPLLQRQSQVRRRHRARTDQDLAQLALLRQQCRTRRIGVFGFEPFERLPAHASPGVSRDGLNRRGGIECIGVHGTRWDS